MNIKPNEELSKKYTVLREQLTHLRDIRYTVWDTGALDVWGTREILMKAILGAQHLEMHFIFLELEEIIIVFTNSFPKIFDGGRPMTVPDAYHTLVSIYHSQGTKTVTQKTPVWIKNTLMQAPAKVALLHFKRMIQVLTRHHHAVKGVGLELLHKEVTCQEDGYDEVFKNILKGDKGSELRQLTRQLVDLSPYINKEAGEQVLEEAFGDIEIPYQFKEKTLIPLYWTGRIPE